MIKKVVKQVFRNIIFPTLYILRLYKIFSFRTSNKCLIINYHGVIEKENFKYNGRHFPKHIFERHLKHFKNNFDVVPLEQIFEMYRKHIVPSKKTIAITFDDGFENNYSVAYPLLKKYNLPATFFISAICTENNQAILWSEVIDILNQFKKKIIVDDLVFEKKGKANFYNAEKKINISDYIKKSNAFDRDRIIQELSSKYNLTHLLEKVEPDIWKLMGKKQIKELSASGIISIGSHGYNHYNLANVTEEEAFLDLKKSTDLLEAVTENKIESIAFPDSSYTEKVKKMCLSLGYKDMCAVPYHLPEDKMDQNLLPRHGMSATTNYFSNIIFIHSAFNNLGF